jgi:hypothetical protein
VIFRVRQLIFKEVTLKMAITDVVIRNAKPRDKAYKLFDERGLFIQITPAGGKWWRFKFRFDGKEKLLSLGTYPDVPLKAARDKRDEARKLIAAGVNPSESRKATKAAKHILNANTFEVIAREWIQSHMKDKAVSHRDRTLRRFEVYLFPWIGNKPISELKSSELLIQIMPLRS